MMKERYTTNADTAVSPEMLAKLGVLLENQDFRQVMSFLLDAAGVNSSIFKENDAANRFAEGYRGFGLMLQRLLIQASFPNFQLMQKEYYDAEMAQALANGRNRGSAGPGFIRNSGLEHG